MSSTFKRLLVVDDDANILRLIKKIFENVYDLRISKSPNEALKMIEEGFKPGVILSDQIMPHMNGAEFLNIAIQHVPSAVKVVLTGHTETSDIIQCVNEARAHLYLTKPFKQIELVQAVKIAFEHHKSVHQNMNAGALTQGLATKQNELQRTIDNLKGGLKNMADQMVVSYQIIAKTHDRLSYVAHSDYVTALVMEMLKHIEVRSDLIKKLISAAKIHNAYRSCIPEHLSIKKPMDISDTHELELWLHGFRAFMESLKATGLLESKVEIIENLFENRIGTGMPNQKEDKAFNLSSQILAVANKYVMDVYGIVPSDYEYTERKGPWEQTESETLERHEAALQDMEDKKLWYEEKVRKGLLKALESNEAFTPKKETLRIE